MALERKDVRAKLDAEDLDRLKAVCDFDEKDIGEWVEQLILREIDRRYAAARKESSLVDRLESLGKTGKSRESSVDPGNTRR